MITEFLIAGMCSMAPSYHADLTACSKASEAGLKQSSIHSNLELIEVAAQEQVNKRVPKAVLVTSGIAARSFREKSLMYQWRVKKQILSLDYIQPRVSYLNGRSSVKLDLTWSW